MHCGTLGERRARPSLALAMVAAHRGVGVLVRLAGSGRCRRAELPKGEGSQVGGRRLEGLGDGGRVVGNQRLRRGNSSDSATREVTTGARWVARGWS